ncbi:MAG: hypothetical protein ACOZAM_15630 [Pseudomonadota bacterium]
MLAPSFSAVIACGLDRLEKKEHAACLSAAMDKFKRNSDSLTALAEQPETNFAIVGVEFLLKSWREVAAEFATAKDSPEVDNPLCLKMHRAFAGGLEPLLEELEQVRVALIQGELINLCSKPVD